MEVHAWAAKHRGAALEPLCYELGPPEGHDCTVKVRTCGICHSDLHMVDDDWGMTRFPLVPGHEVLGEVVEVGPMVRHLRVGDRVGVGWQAGACMHCRDCLRGEENLCDHTRGLIVGHHGGFADFVQADARFCFPIPEGVGDDVAGPLLCGGVTVFSALRHAGMGSGMRIGVIGVGGLGHMAVMFASRLGNHVTAFTTSEDKAAFASELGAAEVIVVPRGKEPPAPKRPLDVVVNTVPAPLDWASYLGMLGSDGTLCFVAAPVDRPIAVPFFPMLSKRRRIMASPIGGRSVMREMLETAALFGVRPHIETFPMARVNDALEHVRSNKVRYRAVLTSADRA